MLVITACNDDDITVPKDENEAKVAESASDPKFIVFESVSEYDSILDTLSNMDDSLLLAWAQGFVGYNCRLSVSTESQLEADGIYDEVLATILSEQNIVQIDQHVFQLNFSTEEVYAIHENDYDNPSNFNSENADMETYSFNDEVLDLVSNKKSGTHNIGCGDWEPTNVTTNIGTVKRFVRYNRHGIYFSFRAKIQKNYRFGDTYMELEAKNVRFRRNSTSNWRDYEDDTQISDYGKWKKRCKHNIYSGFRHMGEREGEFTFSLYWNTGLNSESDLVIVNCPL